MSAKSGVLNIIAGFVGPAGSHVSAMNVVY
jgi:ABC-type thiamine transport system ATPase subunit